MVEINQDKLNFLVTAGFDETLAKYALSECNNDEERAVTWIMEHQNDPSIQTTPDADFISKEENQSLNSSTSSQALVPYDQNPNAPQNAGAAASAQGSGNGNGDAELEEAIKASLQENKKPREEPKQQDDEMTLAIQQSLLANASQSSADTLKKRDSDQPIGMLNIGNTCYVNSLLQSFFMLPEFRSAVLNFDINSINDLIKEAHHLIDQLPKPEQSQSGKDNKNKKYQSTDASESPKPAPQEEEEEEENSVKSENELFLKIAETIVEKMTKLQELFAFMSMSIKSYIDPSSALTTMLRQSDGTMVQLGNQEDLHEFNSFFLNTVEEGLCLEERLNKFIEEVSKKVEIAKQKAQEERERQENEERKENSTEPTEESNENEEHENKNNKNSGEELMDSENEDNTQVQHTDHSSNKQSAEDVEMSDAEETENVQQERPRHEVSEQDEINKNNLIKQLFFGQTSEEYTTQEEDGTPVERKIESIFCTQILYVSQSLKDLYSSLDYITTPEPDVEFTTPRGYKTQATKSNWFTRLPPVLIFQLQRSTFDSAKQEASKINLPFSFEKNIFMDRYLERNKEITQQKRQQVSSLQRYKSHLEQEMNHLTEYGDEQQNIEQVFRSTLNALEDCTTEGSNLHRLLDLSSLNNPEISTVNSVLSKLYSIASEKIQEIKNEINEKDREIASVYEDMSDEKYQLRAVLVHSGTAGSGHYWAFIHHPQHDAWFKYNDARVSRVDESEVMSSAQGGQAHSANAYCLFYVSEKYHEKEEFSLNIPEHLKQMVEQDNYDFEEELEAEKDEVVAFVRFYKKTMKEFQQYKYSGLEQLKGFDKRLDSITLVAYHVAPSHEYNAYTLLGELYPQKFGYEIMNDPDTNRRQRIVERLKLDFSEDCLRSVDNYITNQINVARGYFMECTKYLIYALIKFKDDEYDRALWALREAFKVDRDNIQSQFPLLTRLPDIRFIFIVAMHYKFNEGKKKFFGGDRTGGVHLMERAISYLTDHWSPEYEILKTQWNEIINWLRANFPTLESLYLTPMQSKLERISRVSVPSKIRMTQFQFDLRIVEKVSSESLAKATTEFLSKVNNDLNDLKNAGLDHIHAQLLDL